MIIFEIVLPLHVGMSGAVDPSLLELERLKLEIERERTKQEEIKYHLPPIGKFVGSPSVSSISSSSSMTSGKSKKASHSDSIGFPTIGRSSSSPSITV